MIYFSRYVNRLVIMMILFISGFLFTSAETSYLPGCTSYTGHSSLNGNLCDTGCTSGVIFSAVSGNLCEGKTVPVQTPTYQPGCTSASGWSSTTGKACDGSGQQSPYPVGCTSKLGFSSVTGYSCSISNILVKTPSDITDIDTSNDDSTCVVINNNLSYKNRRNNNKDDVMSLQDFLSDKGYLKVDSITGFFGKITEKAVSDFQRDNNLIANPEGFVGFGTRKKIQLLTCNEN